MAVVVIDLLLKTEIVIIMVQIRESYPTTRSGLTMVVSLTNYIFGFVNTDLVLSKSNGMVQIEFHDKYLI